MSAQPNLRPQFQEPAPAPVRRSLVPGIAAALAFAAATAAGAWLWFRPAPAPPPLRTAVVRRATLPISLRIAGSTSARRFSNVTAPRLRVPESGRDMVILTLLPSGTVVQPGDVVARFNPQGTLDHLDDTRDALDLRQTVLAKTHAEVDLLVEALAQNLRRARAALDTALLDQQTSPVRSRIQVERFALAVAEARAELAALRAELPFHIASHNALLRQFEIDAEIERIHVERHERDLARLTLRAPAAGMVVLRQLRRRGASDVTYAVGDRLYPGGVLMQVADRSSMQMEGFLNQADSSRFRIGQPATIRLDAYPQARYSGAITAIGSMATPVRRRGDWLRAIPVQVRIDNPDSRLLPDLSASADIVVENLENALILPAEALIQDDGLTFVELHHDGNLERRPVTGARIHGPHATVLDGLQAGDVVVLDHAQP